MLNPLLDLANCDLLQPADINDIILDSFLTVVDAFSNPMDRNRQGIMNRAISLARLYDPILVLGCLVGSPFTGTSKHCHITFSHTWMKLHDNSGKVGRKLLQQQQLIIIGILFPS